MTRFIKTVLTTAAILASATAAHAGDTFTASFKYDANATAQVNLNSFQESASLICAKQLSIGGFRRTDATSYQQRKCERELVKSVVKASRNERLISLHQDRKNGVKTVLLALNTAAK